MLRRQINGKKLIQELVNENKNIDFFGIKRAILNLQGCKHSFYLIFNSCV
jgi:hypothetical protein